MIHMGDDFSLRIDDARDIRREQESRDTNNKEEEDNATSQN
jgi:hypothetical protein